MAKILLVDDSLTVLEGLKLFLSGEGHDLILTTDGSEGLEAAKANSDIDLMIVDVNMPVMDGLTMVDHIRELPEHAKTPIFMLTTESDAKLIRRAKSVGVTAWLVKPCKPEFLKRGIQKVLSGK